MDFQFDEVQQSIRQMVKAFVDREVRPVAMEYELEDRYPTPIVEKMRALGFFGFTIPEQYGGSGLDEVCYAILMEELSVGWMSLAGILGTHMMTAWMILHFGTDAQRETYLPKMATGEWHAGMALTEPGSGSDAAALRTAARREQDQWVVNGTKMFVSNAEHGTMFSVFVRTDPARPKARGISCLLIHKGTPGFRVGRHLKKLGYRGLRTSELIFEDARVPLENLLGEENAGFPMIMSALEGGTRIEASKLLTYQAAALKSAGRRCDLAAGMAKLFASETAEFCASEAMQIHGGMGYIQELPVERYFRDSKLLTVGEGPNEIQRLIIARRLLERFPV